MFEMRQEAQEALWMEPTPIGADSPHPEVAAVTDSQTRRGRREASLFRILLLLRASSHFHPFPPSPTPDSSLYHCSHKSHNAPVIITPTPVYLQPVAWRGASLSLSVYVSLSSPSCSLIPLFLSCPFFFLHLCHLSSLFFCSCHTDSSPLLFRSLVHRSFAHY